MRTQVQKWGNSLAVRIPKGVAERARLRQGDQLEFTVLRQGTVKLRRSGRRLSLAQLVRRITKRNRHGEVSWGPKRGREVW